MDSSASFVIGQSNYFGLCFTALNWKLLYLSGIYSLSVINIINMVDIAWRLEVYSRLQYLLD